MTFADVVAMLGGAAKVNRILGLKDKHAKDIRRAVAANAPRAKWIPILKDYAISHSKELVEWAK